MTTSVDVRARLVETFRRDLVGPNPVPDDEDIARERLKEQPSRWYLTGFLAPAADAPTVEETDAAFQEELELEVAEPVGDGAGGAAGDNEQPEAPSAKRRFLPSSVGLTVMLSPEVEEIEAVVTWGDYRTEPPISADLLAPDEPDPEDPEGKRKKKPERPPVEWVRAPQRRVVKLTVPDWRGRAKLVPESAAPQLPGGGLELEAHARTFAYDTPEGREEVRVLTVFLVNRRAKSHRAYEDVSCVFQARLELVCPQGFRPRRDLSGYRAADPDLRLADLHYRDVTEWAVGRNTAASWHEGEAAQERVTRVWTDPLPRAEVERVAPNEDEALTSAVVFGMEDLAARAELGGQALDDALAGLPKLYGAWITVEKTKLAGLAPLRRATAEKLIADMETARERITEGLKILASDDTARTAFQFMNLAVAMAARKRSPERGDPTWRPFQLAFILLNIAGLADRTHTDRERADLLFFPTGGGKTEAYLGLAAFVITLRRLRAQGVLGAGVAVIMRYTLRLLTLDQLARAAGVICALELLRTDPKNMDDKGRRTLGDWPIEIGLWVGSDASPNRLGGKGDADQTTAVGRVRRYTNGTDKRAPAPIKECPWCGTPFSKKSFACRPTNDAPKNLEIRCANTSCNFTGDRALPILTVDEPIYRRLPAFLIATVDKFASLPWVGESGAFFGHVDRHDSDGFYGPANPGEGRPLDNGWTLAPPDLVIQDELHLISGPLGTVAGLYETAIDHLATRHEGGKRIRPKIVASTATVRRASAQIRALFDRQDTAIFPPPGIDRTDSFFALTVPASKDPARLYLGVAAQGRGPKLVFLRSLTTLLAGAQAAYEAEDDGSGPGKNPADPYMSALCYFNALRELGGALRIVQDEVKDRASRYGQERRRVEPEDAPFADRRVREPLEITSRIDTDKVAAAKQQLATAFGGNAEPVDVALATNMISVGLDITRLGLMVVQGQPKTAAEYIQATSRVGRDHDRPGLVLVVLNLHKPRDRTHYEQFGQFHRTFYRAVEATSVTPWAARALDRALAAVVVAAARHHDPALTPDTAASTLKDRPETQAAVIEAIVSRAPPEAIPGGAEALRKLVQGLLEAWITSAAAQASAGAFRFAGAKSPRRLLHMPLEPEIKGLTPPHDRFVAGRSMRDVEPSVPLEPRNPWGDKIANASDLT